MGINGFSQFLKKQFPAVYKKIKISELRGKRIAIDANNWMHVNMYFANNNVSRSLDVKGGQELDRPTVVKNWLDMCLSFTVLWIEHRITPIFVFDGAYPEEKKNTQSDRHDKKIKVREEIASLKNQLGKMSISTDASTDVLYPGGVPLAKTPEEISDRIKKLIGQDTSVSRDDVTILKNVLASVGIPVIVSPGEAEKFCAYLNIHGYADLVFTSDSDAMCFGTRIQINKILGKEDNELMLQTLELEDILKNLKMTKETFIDLCIMAGCDYNENMPGIAMGKSFKLLEKCQRIENLDKKYDITCLKHEVCRKLFQHEDIAVDPLTLEINKEVFIDKGRSVLRNLGLEHQINRLIPIIVGDNELLELFK